MPAKSRNIKGFTIIEVVLVLAIAGLIFLMVFIALPALQSGQRDTQRKQDLGRMVSQVVSWQSNHQGQLPTSTQWDVSFKNDYLTSGGSQFSDPTTGSTYTITQQSSLPTTPLGSSNNPGAGAIWVYIGARCGGTNGVQTLSGNRNYAAVIYQEQGGYTCQGNN